MKASAPALKISWYTMVNGSASTRTEAPRTPRIDRIRDSFGGSRPTRAGWSGFTPRVEERVDLGDEPLEHACSPCPMHRQYPDARHAGKHDPVGESKQAQL